MFSTAIQQLAAISVADWIAIVTGVAYAILAVFRSRWCWAAGIVSSSVLAFVAFRSQLPMQAGLQVFYVAMSLYGFWRWSAAGGNTVIRISRWPLTWHVAVLATIAACAWFAGPWLGASAEAAWPRLDMLVMLSSLLATWMTAQGKLENWTYWIVIDAASVFLYFAQGAAGAALLYLLYIGTAVAGALTWVRQYRLQEQVASA